MNWLESLVAATAIAFGVSTVAAAFAAVKLLRDRLKRDSIERSEFEAKSEPKANHHPVVH